MAWLIIGIVNYEIRTETAHSRGRGNLANSWREFQDAGRLAAFHQRSEEGQYFVVSTEQNISAYAAFNCSTS